MIITSYPPQLFNQYPFVSTSFLHVSGEFKMIRHSHFTFALVVACLLGVQQELEAGVIFGNSGLNGGFRWDAAPRTIGGLERSLQGGLRYSIQGGSFQAYRDSFTWAGAAPSVPQFQQAVQQAFDAWGSTDPVSGLSSSLQFIPDLASTVNPAVVGGVRLGAEIDLFAINLGDAGTRGFANFNAVGGTVSLTSGTVNYNAAPISGADITINANPGAVYTLDIFRRLLTHEIGHTIGLGDVEGDINPNRFIDDNFDGTSSASALATLTNSWAHLVDPFNPAASPLSIFHVSHLDPGVGTPGVNILMESRGLGIGLSNPISNLIPLTNDDYGMRQFLYPTVVPEPSSLLILSSALSLFWLHRRRS